MATLKEVRQHFEADPKRPLTVHVLANMYWESVKRSLKKKGVKILRAEYIEVMNTYFKTVVDELHEGRDIKLPRNFGWLYVSKVKKSLSDGVPDYAACFYEGRRARYANNNTNGYVYVHKHEHGNLKCLKPYRFKASKKWACQKLKKRIDKRLLPV